MESKVLFHAAQEVPSSEMIFVQDSVQSAFDNLINDLVIRGVYYKGLVVTKNSATELQIGTGRFWSAGKSYGQKLTTTVQLTAYLPAGANQKIIALVASGQEVETNAAPRKFLVDPNTRTVRSRPVNTRKERNVVVGIVEGAEGLAPVAPVVDIGYAILAYVTLSSTGIVGDPVQVVTHRAPNLQDTVSQLTIAEAALARQLGLINTLRSDIAGLARQIAGLAPITDVRRLDLAIRDVREAAGVQDGATFYGRDSFATDDESDTAHGSYQASAGGGVMSFPAPAAVTSTLALLNPLDSKVKIASNGLVLPDYDEVVRLSLDAQDQEIAIASYPVVTHTTEKKTIGYKFKWFKTKHGGLAKTMAKTGGEVELVDPKTGNKVKIDLDKYEWKKAGDFGPGVWIYIEDFRPYWDENTTTVNVTGASVAQTFLNAQSGWVTGLSIKVKEKAASGDIRVMLCECLDDGTPNVKAVLEDAVLAHAAIATGWNKVAINPAHISRGVRYAIVVKTGGAHKLWGSGKNDLANGTLFYASDDSYWDGQLGRDMSFQIHTAQFKSTRVEVNLQSVSVVGGISEMDFTMTGVRPSAVDFDIQAQVAGLWRNIDAANANVFATEPNLVPLRAVWGNTQHDAVGFVLAESVVTAYKPDNSAVHISTARTLPGSDTASEVRVELVANDFNDAHHTVVAKIRHGASYATVATAAATRTVALNSGQTMFEFTFDFSGGPISTYKVQIELTTSSAAYPFSIDERYDYAKP